MVRIILNKDQEIKNVVDSLTQVGEEMISKMKERAPVATGALVNGIRFEIEVNEKSVDLIFSFPFYAQWVEWGRPPGKMPPLEAIRAWLRVKGIEEKAAFPIARAIGRLGTRPQPFIRPTIDIDLVPALKKALPENFR